MAPDDRLLDSGVVHHYEMNACPTDMSSTPCESMSIIDGFTLVHHIIMMALRRDGVAIEQQTPVWRIIIK
jgi:hypothetical protein